ncbi:hypothetical protein N9247_00095 [bacterium]|nr:hypothetical protein [bacterium]
MAWVYEVCQLRDTGYSANANNSGGQKSCQLNLTQKYIVIVTDPSDANFHGSQVNDIHAAFAKDSVTNVRIPLVNYNTYYDPVANVTVPLAVCTSKTVRRKQENTAVFEVDCTFQTGGGSGGAGGAKQGKAQESETPQDPEPQEPPTNVTDISPVVTRSVVGRDIVLHSAPAYGADGLLGGDIDLGVRSTRFLPTVDLAAEDNKINNEIDQPITRKQPLLQITVTQFEDTFTDEDLLKRCFRVNTQEYRGFPVKSAMITAINAVEQNVQLDAGPADKYRVTYNILIDEYSAEDSSGTSLFIGHAQGVPLIGHWYYDENGDAKQFLVGDNTGIGNVGLVSIYGEALGSAGVPGSQLGAPDYVRFDTVDEIDFADFMQA